MQTLAIGDIHGCFQALNSLMKLVRPTKEDRVIFLGDYIDRGPASKTVIEWMIHETKAFQPVFLRGNHEVMILEAQDDPLKAKLWQSYGGFEMLISYGAEYREDWTATIPESHWNFFRKTKENFETDTHIFVHASLAPDLDLDLQPDLFLYWEFFDRIQPHKSGKKVICGHSPQQSGEIKNIGFAACIDTNVAHGGWLTCLDAQSGEFWQANEKGQTRTGRLPI